MTVLGLMSGANHEQVLHCADHRSGLRAIIAVHSTVLGPALGGTRFRAYHDEAAALADVLALSQAMTYKNALAGLDHGGGKAVLIGDPVTTRSEPLLRTYGRFLAGMNGRYVTAADVGTTTADMDMIGRECRWTTGRSEAEGGGGDSGILTALGVWQGMRAAVAFSRNGGPAQQGERVLTGARVGLLGCGKVGARLARHLVLDEGATVVAYDVDAAALRRLTDSLPDHPNQLELAGSPHELAAAELDVYSPNALGQALGDEVVAMLSASVVCGGANNQIVHSGTASALAARGITYAPDFCVNAGGVIQVADEFRGFSFERARTAAMRIGATTTRVLSRAAADGVTTELAAIGLAQDRIDAVAGVRRVLV